MAVVFDAVSFFRPFGVVEAVEGTHQVAGDAPDAFKRLAFKMIGQIDKIAIEMDFQAFELFVGIKFFGAV